MEPLVVNKSDELLKLIKSKLVSVNREQLIKNIGYNSIKKGLKRLDNLLSSKNLAIWLRSGSYDLVH